MRAASVKASEVSEPRVDLPERQLIVLHERTAGSSVSSCSEGFSMATPTTSCIAAAWALCELSGPEQASSPASSFLADGGPMAAAWPSLRRL